MKKMQLVCNSSEIRNLFLFPLPFFDYNTKSIRVPDLLWFSLCLFNLQWFEWDFSFIEWILSRSYNSPFKFLSFPRISVWGKILSHDTEQWYWVQLLISHQTTKAKSYYNAMCCLHIGGYNEIMFWEMSLADFVLYEHEEYVTILVTSFLENSLKPLEHLLLIIKYILLCDIASQNKAIEAIMNTSITELHLYCFQYLLCVFLSCINGLGKSIWLNRMLFGG